ncbi:leucyl aminopeptidase [Jeotgalibacillus salarius]|uniref:Probable cytosol aminopeptidase n=1 Tax=Jeotgalibacillus salarius TaxID=546023 RepID=A0A4Y8LL62_9BACL|nr:leucyl aminopeptidase [Jeotgalibacillus salarius]TFE03782.1 leucyl aminopeptidase [Jeotgalibacillus salarius]
MKWTIHTNENVLDQQHEYLAASTWHQPVVSGFSKELDDQMKGGLTELIKEGDIEAKSRQITVLPTLGALSAKRIIFSGLGKESNLSFEELRECFGVLGKTLKKKKVSSLAIALDSYKGKNFDATDVAQALIEGITLAMYEFEGYKKKSNVPDVALEELHIYSKHDAKELEAALEVGEALADGTNEARTLVNMPSNLLTSVKMADYAQEMAERHGFDIEILGKEEIEEMGMGALLAVNQGSEIPPRMIVMKHQVTEQWDDVLALVGKGITFDTGGYSIKPKDGIVGMKADMGGAAAVLGAMEIIGRLKPEQNVMAVIAATDNMISHKAFKPDDVITSMSGKTIEILNTDAEGRLVLADAVTYAKQHGADYLVDVATLTGGVVVALGLDKTGALTNNEPLFEKVLEASVEAGEFIWQLPYTEGDRKRVRNSPVADLNNSPGRDGHALFAGAFIGEFTEGTPWVHLDIAGTATTKSAHLLGPAGGTGAMARTLALLTEQFVLERTEK